LAYDPGLKKQLLREMEFNERCESDWICRHYGCFSEPVTSTISIAMEYCEGGSLDGVYKEARKYDGVIGEKVFGKIAESVLRGLTYLHSLKIIHRGI
jgi:mitogen-activated protein kinase kinase